MNTYFGLAIFLLMLSMLNFFMGIKEMLKDYIFVEKDSRVVSRNFNLHDFNMTDNDGNELPSPQSFILLTVEPKVTEKKDEQFSQGVEWSPK